MADGGNARETGYAKSGNLLRWEESIAIFEIEHLACSSVDALDLLLDDEAEAAEPARHARAVHTVHAYDLLVILKGQRQVLLRRVVRIVLGEDLVVRVLEAHRVNEALLTVVAREGRDLSDLSSVEFDRLLESIMLALFLEEGRLGSVAHLALHRADVDLILAALERNLAQLLVGVRWVKGWRPVEVYITDPGVLPTE